MRKRKKKNLGALSAYSKPQLGISIADANQDTKPGYTVGEASKRIRYQAWAYGYKLPRFTLDYSFMRKCRLWGWSILIPMASTTFDLSKTPPKG